MDIKNDAGVKSTFNEQLKQLSEMNARHRKEEWELYKSQLESNFDLFKKIVEAIQADQVKQLADRQAKDVKDLNSKQAKVSVETAKEVQNDKTLKTKNAKDKRLREKKANNLKKFMDEKKVVIYFDSLNILQNNISLKSCVVELGNKTRKRERKIEKFAYSTTC